MSQVAKLLSRAEVQVLSVDAKFDEQLEAILDRLLGKMATRRRDVLDQIISVVKSHDAGTVVVENAYVDLDYLQTYSQHYSKAFRQKPSQCVRLHFFSGKLSQSQVLELDDSAKNRYLGFACLRPTGNQYVSRTVVVPPRPPNDAQRFVHAAGEFRTHLLGQRLTVRGTPFIQQDINTFVCAGAAIWSIGLLMHNRIGIPRYCPGEISNLAMERFSHGQLRKGLTSHQIVMTLRAMGLNPHVESWFNLHQMRKMHNIEHKELIRDIADYIHVHVDSDLPPLLAYSEPTGEGHAVAVVGHDIHKRSDAMSRAAGSPKRVLHNSEFVDEFYVMDDARGPYVPFSICDSGDSSQPSLESCDQITIVAPVPEEVSLNYHDACLEFEQFLGDWNQFVELYKDDLEGLRLDQARIENTSENPLVLRPTLIDSRDWKRRMIESEMPQWLRHRYQTMHMPKYIWVIEVSDWTHTNLAKRCERRICGEIILDGSANPHWPWDSLLGWHMKGLVWDASPTDDEIEHVMLLDGFKWYPSMLRAI